MLPPLPPGKPTRLTLARWLVSPENPLTSRVAVNRVWQELFGRGIVVHIAKISERRANRPAIRNCSTGWPREYMARGWSMKQMIRLIVTSSTYRQSSNARPELEAQATRRTRCWRDMSRLRLPAELVRDETLSAAGLLNLQDRRAEREASAAQGRGRAFVRRDRVKWVESTGADRYRRGLYIHFPADHAVSAAHEFRRAQQPNLSCTRRERTDTPLQALNLMNDPVFFEAAQGLAFRVMRESSGPFRDRLDVCVQD